MNISHAKLYPQKDGTFVHAAPNNGRVHDGHPRDCASPQCKSWAALMNLSPDQQMVDRINANLREDEERGMALVAWTVIGAAFVFCVVAAIFIWRYML